MIKISNIYKCLLAIAIFFLCDFVYIVAPELMKGNALLIRFLIGVIGVILTCWVFSIRKSRAYDYSIYRIADNYLGVYSIIIIVVITMTTIQYNYTINQIMFVIAPYLYIYFTYPLIYIFSCEQKEFKFITEIVKVIVLMIIIKAICWVAYSKFGVTLFSYLTFQYENWYRNGTLRIDGGCLLGFTFAYIWSNSYIKDTVKRRIISFMILCFVLFVTQYRFQSISLCVTIFSCYWVSSNGKYDRNNRKIVGSLAVLLFIVLGGASNILDSFSSEGVYGGSTIVRIQTIAHYWDLMIDKKAIFGLGMLNQGNATCYEMMGRANQWGLESLYYLSDIGILGGFFQFGLLSIPLYGLLFCQGWKTLKLCQSQKKQFYSILVGALISYMFFSNFALNFFDIQRAFGLSFVLSIFSYLYGECLTNKSNQNS